jgi:hypothetical protein
MSSDACNDRAIAVSPTATAKADDKRHDDCRAGREIAVNAAGKTFFARWHGRRIRRDMRRAIECLVRRDAAFLGSSSATSEH